MKAMILIFISAILSTLPCSSGQCQEAAKTPESPDSTAERAMTTSDETFPELQLRTEVMKLIRLADLSDVPRHQRDATIEFLISNDDQFVVLHIDSYSEHLKSFIKKRLNYHQVATEGVRKMTPYSLDVQFAVKQEKVN